MQFKKLPAGIIAILLSLSTSASVQAEEIIPLNEESYSNSESSDTVKPLSSEEIRELLTLAVENLNTSKPDELRGIEAAVVFSAETDRSLDLTEDESLLLSDLLDAVVVETPVELEDITAAVVFSAEQRVDEEILVEELLNSITVDKPEVLDGVDAAVVFSAESLISETLTLEEREIVNNLLERINSNRERVSTDSDIIFNN
ncbi:hypothetical protein BIY24_15585 [Halobacteriovorax marinus]|uniref:hypothetical protein n=1 Tax=Halobacteriovorax marinus TaxID=97084 RepID=UPI000BC2FE06|nr:hypothetical protein [Halobacteriovorax marinus]ATH09313.1 hypothetical protein BIY24_15585 [Halobacteriovorax marinus]